MVTKWEKLSIKELEEVVRKHNELYFLKQQPEISDEEFDRLVEILKKKKPDSAALQEIGSDIALSEKTVRHEVPMLSLDKCYEEKDLLHWASKFEGKIVGMPKIDGCAVSLHYGADGKLSLAATRGSGIEGEVITNNVRYVKSIPQQIKLKNVEVRGEVYMPLSIFEKFREAFANPRNLAAGAIKQKDPKKTGEYHLSFFAFDLLGTKAATEEEKRHLLKKEKFPLVEAALVTQEKTQSLFERFYQEREKRDYESDGVVFKVNLVQEQERLGVTAHHPRYAIAYKFQGDAGETTLREVIWSVSRTGVITPVGVVEPVTLSGASVTRVSLHNYGLAKKMGITIPAKVLMIRRGGVIPNIEKVIEGKGKPLTSPRKCPSCGSPVELKDDFLYCTQPKKCAVTKVGELNHFVKVVGIDGFGRKHLQQLYDSGLVQDAADFYSLTVEELVPLDRMGETLAKKLVANIQARRKLLLDLFLRSLGIHELGKHASKILSDFGSLEKVLKLKEEDLSAIHTIGEKIASSVIQGLSERQNLIDRLLKQITLEKSVAQKKQGPLKGVSFLFTGSLLAMSRTEAQKLVEAKGGVAVDSVTRNLDYLVIGDGGGAGSKLEKVKKLQQTGAAVQILSEKEFLKKVG